VLRGHAPRLLPCREEPIPFHRACTRSAPPGRGSSTPPGAVGACLALGLAGLSLCYVQSLVYPDCESFGTTTVSSPHGAAPPSIPSEGQDPDLSEFLPPGLRLCPAAPRTRILATPGPSRGTRLGQRGVQGPGAITRGMAATPTRRYRHSTVAQETLLAEVFAAELPSQGKAVAFRPTRATHVRHRPGSPRAPLTGAKVSGTAWRYAIPLRVWV
jgi:hypothetical protein